MTTMVNMEPCKHREFCGGCKHNGEAYEDTLKAKEEEALGYLKKWELAPDEYYGITGCPENERFRYRNKMEYTFGDLVKGGELSLGMHKSGQFMSIVTVDECQLVSEDFNRVLSFTLEFCKERGYAHYNKKKHTGLLRNLVVRRGLRTGELLVDIVTASDNEEYSFDEEGWKDGLLGLQLSDDIVGIMRTINDQLSDAVICDEQRILFGRDYYLEELLGLKFKVNIFSFFQTNVQAVERLYTKAVEFLGDVEGMKVFDLYCGTGTISQIVAKSAKSVTGVEIVEESVAAAKENVKLNGLENCNFICGDVFEVLNNLDELPDAIIVDPPRVGMRNKAVDKISSYGVDKIVYVSCNPKTLAIDLAQFRENGYKLVKYQLFDNFCWTNHSECVALLSRTE